MWQEVLGYVLLRVGLPAAQCVTVDGSHSTYCYSPFLSLFSSCPAFVLCFEMTECELEIPQSSLVLLANVLSVKCCVHVPCCSTAEPVRIISPCLLPVPPFQNSSDLFYSLSFKGSLFWGLLSPFGTGFISLCNLCCSTRSPAACLCLITSIVSYSIFNIVPVRRS